MRTLLVMRHGKSSWSDPSLADHDRPLKKRGRRDAPRMADRIEAEGLVPGSIVTSTAERARATAELVAAQWLEPVVVHVNEDLYGGAPEDWLDMISALDPEVTRLMVVGHNPGLEQLVEVLTGAVVHLPTAAVAVIELPIEAWADVTEVSEGVLRHLLIPREM